MNIAILLLALQPAADKSMWEIFHEELSKTKVTAAAPATAPRSCPCSDNCKCGCRDGLPCICRPKVGESVTPAPTSASAPNPRIVQLQYAPAPAPYRAPIQYRAAIQPAFQGVCPPGVARSVC